MAELRSSRRSRSMVTRVWIFLTRRVDISFYIIFLNALANDKIIVEIALKPFRKTIKVGSRLRLEPHTAY